jgi:hypothetical protein
VTLIGWSLGLLAVIVVVFVLLFLGGLLSAALEIRREKRAGQVPTRPAWENRDKRRALGGFREVWRVSVQRAKHRGIDTCWCGQGPLAYFPQMQMVPNQYTVGGIGCAAWEAGDPLAHDLHDRAGGYARTPAPDPLAVSA